METIRCSFDDINVWSAREKNWRWVIKAAGLFRANVIWKLSGTKSSGKLIAALNSPNENLRTLAGIFLVRSGRRAIPLLEEELANRRNLPRILLLLGDMDEPESEVPEEIPGRS